MGQELRSLQVRIERLSEAGNAVIATIRIAGEGRSSGVEVDMHVHLVFTFEEGLVVRRHVFQRREEPLEAVALRE